VEYLSRHPEKEALPIKIYTTLKDIKALTPKEILDKINNLSSSMVDDQCDITEYNFDVLSASLGWCSELGYFIGIHNWVGGGEMCYTYIIWNEKDVPANIATINIPEYAESQANRQDTRISPIPNKYNYLTVASTTAKDKVYSRLNLSEDILSSAGMSTGDQVIVEVNPNDGTITIKKRV